MISAVAAGLLSPDVLPMLLMKAAAVADLVAVRSRKGDAVIRELVSQVRLGRDTIDVMIAGDVLATKLGVAASTNSQPVHVDCHATEADRDGGSAGRFQRRCFERQP